MHCVTDHDDGWVSSDRFLGVTEPFWCSLVGPEDFGWLLWLREAEAAPRSTRLRCQPLGSSWESKPQRDLAAPQCVGPSALDWETSMQPHLR